MYQMEMDQMRAVKSILLIGKSQEVLIWIVYCISKSKQIEKSIRIYIPIREKNDVDQIFYEL